MSEQRLTTTAYWEAKWQGVGLPVEVNPNRDLNAVLCRLLPKAVDMTLLEVGCAPGGWMVYLHKTFGYRLMGLEYLESGVAMTQRNLQMQGIPGEIIHADFSTFDAGDRRFDLVFSAGFIEHFGDLEGTVRRICSLSSGYVVTLVPNFCGINWLIRKVMRPGILKTHISIPRRRMQGAHEACGLTTLFCDYVGGLQFTTAADRGRAFFERHRRLSRVINLPVVVFNRLSKGAGRLTGWYPRTELLAVTLMYVGRRETS